MIGKADRRLGGQIELREQDFRPVPRRISDAATAATDDNSAIWHLLEGKRSAGRPDHGVAEMGQPGGDDHQGRYAPNRSIFAELGGKCARPGPGADQQF